MKIYKGIFKITKIFTVKFYCEVEEIISLLRFQAGCTMDIKGLGLEAFM